MKISILASIHFIILFVFVSCAPVEDGGGSTSSDNTLKFLGTWNVSDQPARINYIVEIEKRPGYSDQVILNNFADMGTQIFGLVVNNTIVIDKQTLNEHYSTEGVGTYINASKLEFEFMLDDGIDLEPRLALFTK